MVTIHVDLDLRTPRCCVAQSFDNGDDIESAAQAMVADGLDYWLALTVLGNMGAAPAIEPDGRIFSRSENGAIPANGRRTQTDGEYVELTFGVDNDTYDSADLSELNIEFQQTLNERQQMVWGYGEAA